jgi:hypothetical protein
MVSTFFHCLDRVAATTGYNDWEVRTLKAVKAVRTLQQAFPGAASEQLEMLERQSVVRRATREIAFTSFR